MNRFAYLATGQVIALMQNLSRVRVIVHGQEHIPEGSLIFVVNHFTRMETLLLPYHIYLLTGVPVWTLADAAFFEAPIIRALTRIGAISTRQPDRDLLMVKSLLTGEANWIIFPEGRMVKDKLLVSGSQLLPFGPASVPAHTGAATLAIRTEFYRQRLQALAGNNPGEAARLRKLFRFEEDETVSQAKTWIVPVNITYYPLRARENVLSRLAEHFAAPIPERMKEELLTEGTMLFSGVDVDIRFGTPIMARECLACTPVEQDMFSPENINFDDRLKSRRVMHREAVKMMRRYMTEIYGMTTVNHDHLFASMLRALPLRRISEDDFRRRVFLLASSTLHGTGVYTHQSLGIGQVALLTDDRYNKYRDFSMLARETGVMRVSDGIITKNRVKLNADISRQRARVENPVGVIANEVVPLKDLQRQVHLMAWLPEILVRRRVAELLQRQAEAEFVADYEKFHKAGESKGREVGTPRLLKGKSRDLGVVLVHGFLAAPMELDELAHHLNRAGFWVYTVRLRGHGTAPEDLAVRKGPDWVASVDLGFALMNAICRRVVVGGFSFGGGVALDCAARIDRVAGVFAVAPPMRLQDISSRLAPALDTWNRIMEMLHYEGAMKEYVDSSPERPNINYARIPVAGLWEMERFMKELEPRLPGIKVPALVVQGDGDPVVNPAGSKRLFAELGSTAKEYKTFGMDRHGILAGEGAESVHRVILSFVTGLRR